MKQILLGIIYYQLYTTETVTKDKIDKYYV